MSKYTFIKDYGDGTKITHEFYAETHTEVTEQYQLFMLGGGFVYNEGDYYGLLNDNWEDPPAELTQCNDEWYDEEFGDHGGGSTVEDYKNLDHSAAWPFPHAYTPTPQQEDSSLPFSNFGGERCNICGFTREQMGQNICYDQRCALGLNPKEFK
jgi:hypothetical protein